MTTHHSVWVIIPVHNRREITRRSLLNLQSLRLPPEFLVCVVDDGCTDGTSEMLAREFPSVHVVKGDGNLYWGGGIAAGMQAARQEGAQVHFWLNDDCTPAPGSLERLVARVMTTHGICGGVCFDPNDPSRLTYAGTPISNASNIWNESDPFPAESLNGNLVAIHRVVVEKLGLLPAEHLPHFGGDIIYTLRAHRAGLPVEIDPAARALNQRDNPLQKVLASRSTLRLWREIQRIASPLHFPTYWFLLRERFGWQAWVRWPAFFVRICKLNLQMFRN